VSKLCKVIGKVADVSEISPSTRMKHQTFIYYLHPFEQNEILRFLTVHKNQLDAQLFLSIFRQPLHVSAFSRPIIRRNNRIIQRYLLFFLDD